MTNRALHTGQAPRSTVDRAAAPKCGALPAPVRVARRSADGALCPLPRVPWGSLYRTPADAPSRCRRFEYILSDGKGRLRAMRSRGRALAVLETERTSSDLSLGGEAQGRRHASDRPIARHHHPGTATRAALGGFPPQYKPAGRAMTRAGRSCATPPPASRNRAACAASSPASRPSRSRDLYRDRPGAVEAGLHHAGWAPQATNPSFFSPGLP